MDLRILDQKTQGFINENIGQNISRLALQKNPFPELNWIALLNQIAAKTKAKYKLPSWYATQNIIYPSKISIEQSSSEKTAHYKASLVYGKNLIDLTGGFGVDAYYFAKNVKSVTHCEINPELSNLVAHNFKQLNSTNITCYTGDSLTTLQTLNKKWDWIFIDPSRRNDLKEKVFLLKDCLPNVPENLNFYFNHSNAILIKTAPLLDIAAGLAELKHVKTIHIIAVENEVKELLWELHSCFSGVANIKTINILKDQQQIFDFVLNTHTALLCFSLPQKYLYEPNSAIMKSGGFDEVGAFFKVNKLHKHSHLYTSNELVPFPGRIFEIKDKISYTKLEIKKKLENKQANITIRNFPDPVATIRKKWKIKEGGTTYCFFTTDINDTKIGLICSKIQ